MHGRGAGTVPLIHPLISSQVGRPSRGGVLPAGRQGEGGWAARQPPHGPEQGRGGQGAAGGELQGIRSRGVHNKGGVNIKCGVNNNKCDP